MLLFFCSIHICLFFIIKLYKIYLLYYGIYCLIPKDGRMVILPASNGTYFSKLFLPKREI